MAHIYVGILTIIISIIGGIFATRHYLFYRNSNNNELSVRIRRVFLTDGMIYIMTFLFGIWAVFDWGFNSAISLQIIRIPILILNVIASYRLFALYKTLSGGK